LITGSTYLPGWSADAKIPIPDAAHGQQEIHTGSPK
jgi:hypothetical protein